MPDNWKNTLYYGDNLDILKEYVVSESVDLIYLDPPFNSNRSYNVLFKDESGKEAEAQITAFEDTWHWNAKAEETYQLLVTEGDERVSKMIGALRQFIGANQMMAYTALRPPMSTFAFAPLGLRSGTAISATPLGCLEVD